MIRHGSLFSGIGGFEIAATWLGWQNVFSCEKNPFGKKILQYYWPNSIHHEDIFQFNATKFRVHVDIISGGFPCQPFSNAGKRKGKTDDRYLFPEACRIITEARPEWIVLENVAGLFSILEPDSLSEMEIKAVELFCQNSNQQPDSTIIRLQQRVIGKIISEIQSAGYVLPQLKDGTPIVLCIPAAAVNAPHQRDRIWFVAHTNSDRDEQYQGDHGTGTRWQEVERQEERKRHRGAGILNGFSNLSDASSTIQTHTTTNQRYGQFNPGPFDPNPSKEASDWQNRIPGWKAWPTQPPFCGGNDGLPAELDGITFSNWRTESVKAYGNAIVPQVALEIFRAIATTGSYQ